jgi:predicted RNA-binding protein YlxR (DUF448 family)
MLARAPDNETDNGPKSRGTERFCVVTRAVKPTGEMIRFVVGPDGSVVPDLKPSLPGRGVWVTGTREALTEGLRRKVFARGFKAEVKTAPDLAELTEVLLARSALDALAIAGKAGIVVSGFAKVETALMQGPVAALLHARDAAADGVRKIEAILRRTGGGEGGGNGGEIVIGEFSTGELDLALGRSNVVHAALLAGPAGRTFLTRLQRLRRFRAGDTGKPAHGTTRHDTARRLESE